MKNKSPHLISVFQTLILTFLWSTFFVLRKWGFSEIPPITFAGLRYTLAFLCFFPFIFFNKKYQNEIKKLNSSQWKKLFWLGILFYAFTQGTQYLGLSLLPSVTVSLMLNFTPIIVAISGIFLLKEIPTKLQWLGSILFLLGIFVYFFPISFMQSELIGLGVMFIGVLANSASAVLGRDINRNKDISPLVITFISMGIGAIIMLIVGLMKDGFPTISTNNIYYLIWLAVINTAFAFTLWNLTLRHLSAMESSIINGTMLIQIAILAWIFLGEKITIQEGAGMLIAAVGALFVQLKKKS